MICFGAFMGDGNTTTAQLQRRPFQAGEPVILMDDRGRRHVVRLQAGYRSHHGRTGQVHHDWIIGRPPGLLVRTPEGRCFTCFRPALDDYILKVLQRHTQVIYPKDLGSLLIRGNLYSGARVLEAGLGTGSSTLVLRRFLGPEGELISYEKREDFVALAEKRLDEFDRLYGGLVAPHTIQVRDVYEGIAESDLDTILLDVPEPHRVAKAAAQALRVNGILLCWLPTVIQVFELVRLLNQDPSWTQVETTETLLRPWRVSSQSIRPAHVMVGHTGFLISARRVLEEEVA